VQQTEGQTRSARHYAFVSRNFEGRTYPCPQQQSAVNIMNNSMLTGYYIQNNNWQHWMFPC